MQLKKHGQDKLIVFYDGKCGFCHFFVRFTIAKIGKKQPFIFSTQQGKAFKALKERFPDTDFPDSIVVLNRRDGKISFKSEAIILILRFLRSPWKEIGSFLNILPMRFVNLFYDCIAKVRRGFKKPQQACPIVPKEWRKFFNDE